MEHPDPIDLAVVGAGICGVIALHYARQAGVSALAFDKQDGPGGLWRQLPAWQDLQIATDDWALGELGLASPVQPDVLGNIQAWVDRFGLAGDIRFGCPVQSARHADGLWHVATPQGTVRARHLLAATGAHNRPYVPSVARRDVALQEFHSAQLRDAAALAGRRVLVVGGGASAFDLLDLAFEQGAAHVAWAHRNVRWMQPGRKPKQVLGTVREYGRIQMSGATPQQIDAFLDQDLRARYAKYGISAIAPSAPLDLGRQQLIPGRPRMIEHFAAIERHAAGVEAIDGRTVTFTDGSTVEADLLLWGTGYEMDLSWLQHEALAGIRHLKDLEPRLGGGFVSRDAPNLYFPAIGLDGVGTSTLLYALAMRTLMAHIRGLAQLGTEPLPRRLNHFDLVQFLATRDPVHYPAATWQSEFRALADTPGGQPLPIPASRVAVH